MVDANRNQAWTRLQEAEQLRLQRRFDRAQVVCESLVREHPDYMGALHTLGLIFGDQEKHEEALDCLVRASMLDPNSWMTLTALSEVYLRLGSPEMAVRTIEQARRIKPAEANVLVTLADIHMANCEYELARDTYREALMHQRDFIPAAIGLGWACENLGEYKTAAEIFENLVRRGFNTVEPMRALSVLPKSVTSLDLLAQLNRVARTPGETKEDFDISVAFVKAAALDHAARYADAWESAAGANQKMFAAATSALSSLAEERRQSLSFLQGLSDANRDAHRQVEGQPVSLFILGASRSGKTTMERLVGALDGVKRGFESRSIDNAVRRALQSSWFLTSSALADLPVDLYPHCQSLYREELLKRAGASRVVTNTLTSRMFDAARIPSVFRNVRFIFLKRDIDDNVVQIYLRKYRAGNAYGYDLRTAREHVQWYHQMIDLMAERFPDITRVIRYEDMIARPDAALSMAADLCGLPASQKPAPVLGGDVGCSIPYRPFMEQARAGEAAG